MVTQVMLAAAVALLVLAQPAARADEGPKAGQGEVRKPTALARSSAPGVLPDRRLSDEDDPYPRIPPPYWTWDSHPGCFDQDFSKRISYP